jgi:hypothetical protein
MVQNEKGVGNPHPLSLAGEEAKGYNGLYPFPWEGEMHSETAFAA